MSAWQSATIDVNGLTIHYTRTGGDKPPVVLAHGFSDHGLCWTPVAEVLQADYDVIMVDARGHGKSSDPDEGYGSAEHASDYAGVINGLGLKRPAVLGHSMGAATALALAGLHPELTRAILLEDPPPFWMPPPPEATRPARPGAFANWIVPVKRLTYDELVERVRTENPGWQEAELGPWAESKLRLSIKVLNHVPGHSVDWSAILAQIACPVLLITADLGKGIVGPEAATAFHTGVPHATIVNIPGAGHSIRRDQFAQYMKTIQGFLDQTL